MTKLSQTSARAATLNYCGVGDYMNLSYVYRLNTKDIFKFYKVLLNWKTFLSGYQKRKAKTKELIKTVNDWKQKQGGSYANPILSFLSDFKGEKSGLWNLSLIGSPPPSKKNPGYATVWTRIRCLRAYTKRRSNCPVSRCWWANRRRWLATSPQKTSWTTRLSPYRTCWRSASW